MSPSLEQAIADARERASEARRLRVLNEHGPICWRCESAPARVSGIPCRDCSIALNAEYDAKLSANGGKLLYLTEEYGFDLEIRLRPSACREANGRKSRSAARRWRHCAHRAARSAVAVRDVRSRIHDRRGGRLVERTGAISRALSTSTCTRTQRGKTAASMTARVIR